MSRSRSRLAAWGIGVAGGCASGLLGVGGGIVMVPALVLIARLPQRRAHATSLAAIVPIGVVGMLVYVARDEVNLAMAGLLAAGSVVGAPLGVRALARIDERALRAVFIGVAAVSAIRLLTAAAEPAAGIGGDPAIGGSDVGIALGVGLASGAFAGLLGVGGGIILVPAMTILLAQDQHVAQGTSLLVIVATALAGTRANRARGLLDVPVAFAAGAGGALGAVAGAVFAGELGDVALRRIFAVFLLVVLARVAIDSRARDEA